ncbi:MAG: hypothetical protein ACW99G_24105 [Candidatus Thorarchaeota archaeon]
MAPKRYPKGVTNVSATSPLAQLPTMDPKLLHMYFDDFNEIIYGAIGAGTWVATTGAADGDISLTGSAGGVLVLNAITDTDYSGIQKQLGFVFESGKQAWFGARVKTAEATNMGWAFGLSDIETDFAPGVAGVWFMKADTATAIDLEIWDAGALVAQTANFLTCDTSWTLLECHFDGVDTFTIYNEGLQVAQLATASFPADILTPWVGSILITSMQQGKDKGGY